LCNAWGFQTLYEMPAALQKQVRRQLLTTHLDRLRNGAGGIFEFSAIEWIADWMRWCWSSTPTEEWEAVLETADACLAHYDAVYHLESGDVRAYDGFVWFDKRNAAQQLRLMRMLYRDRGVESKVRSIDEQR
jgi:hypothetical protein